MKIISDKYENINYFEALGKLKETIDRLTIDEGHIIKAYDNEILFNDILKINSILLRDDMANFRYLFSGIEGVPQSIHSYIPDLLILKEEIIKVLKENINPQKIEVNQVIEYVYKDFGNNVPPEGELIVKKHYTIYFSKNPAKIINFFYANRNEVNSGFNYRDFNEQYSENITSDEYKKQVDAINKRIRKETHEFIKVLISQTKNRKQSSNKYYWSKQFR